MKKYTFLLYIFLVLFCVSCQEKDSLMGTLQLSVVENSNLIPGTKAEHVQEQIGLQIINSKGEVIKSTDDWTTLNGQTVLPVGTYTLKAFSALRDGKSAGFDAPFYVGQKEIVIEANTLQSVTIECVLANVKVTVNYSDRIKANFKVLDCTVQNSMGSLTFTKNETRAGYYVAEDTLGVSLALTNNDDRDFILPRKITDVTARSHYRINYDISTTGKGDFDIVLDPSTKEYQVTIKVPIAPDPDAAGITTQKPNAWPTFAYLNAELNNDVTTYGFKYRLMGAVIWQDVPTENILKDGNLISAKVTGLIPGAQYECCATGVDSREGATLVFTTEGNPVLHNATFDAWAMNGKIWYAGTQEEANTKDSFWDSGNVGTATMSKNATIPEESIVHTAGGKSVKLVSQFVGMFGIGQFAAGNIYTGHFVKTIGTSGAEIQFGRAFTSRPTQLHGWFNYSSGTVDYAGDVLRKGDIDQCAIYIALSDKDSRYTVNTSEGKYINYETDPNIIAYGELPLAECVSTNGWKEFTVDLKYRSLTRKPTHLIIVASASKYGDYFCGSTSSVMYIDDFELIYDSEPLIQE